MSTIITTTWPTESLDAPEAIASAVTEAQRLAAAALKAEKNLRRLRDQRADAEKADRDAAASAVAAGKALPKSKAEELEAKISEGERRAEATTTAANRAIKVAKKAVGEHGEEWSQQVAAERAEVADRAGGHLDALRGLASEAGRLRSLDAWLQQARVAEAKRKRWPSQGVSPNVVNFGRVGAAMPPDQVIDGLARHLGAAEQGEEG